MILSINSPVIQLCDTLDDNSSFFYFSLIRNLTEKSIYVCFTFRTMAFNIIMNCILYLIVLHQYTSNAVCKLYTLIMYLFIDCVV
jgi:hypothetical protein